MTDAPIDEPRFGLCPSCSRYTGVLVPDCAICGNARKISFRPWTGDEDATLERHWREGRSATSIGIELRRAIPDLRGRAAELGLPRDPDPPSYVANVQAFGDHAGLFGRRTR